MDDLRVQPETTIGTGLLESYKETELGLLPEEWKVVPLREAVLKAKQVNPKKTPDWHFKYVDVSAISNERLSITDYREYKGKDAPSRARKLILAQDVIFATVRPYLRRVAIVPPELDGEICSTAFCVIRAKSEVADSAFLFFASSTEEFVARVSEYQRGSSYPAVTDNDVLDELIPLPPLPEQEAISHVLRTVQEAIEATEQVIDATRELKRSLMNHLFTYGPVPVDEAEQVPLRETEIGSVPEHWRLVELGQVSRISTGTTPSTKRQDYYSGDIPFIKTSEINNTIINSAKVCVSEQAVEDYRLQRWS